MLENTEFKKKISISRYLFSSFCVNVESQRTGQITPHLTKPELAHINTIAYRRFDKCVK